MLVYDLLTSLVIKYISHSIVMTKNMNHNRSDSDYLWTVCDYLISNKKLKQYWMYPEYNVCTEGWISLGEKCSYLEIFWSKRGKLRPRKLRIRALFKQDMALENSSIIYSITWFYEISFSEVWPLSLFLSKRNILLENLVMMASVSD